MWYQVSLFKIILSALVVMPNAPPEEKKGRVHMKCAPPLSPRED